MRSNEIDLRDGDGRRSRLAGSAVPVRSVLSAGAMPNRIMAACMGSVMMKHTGKVESGKSARHGEDPPHGAKPQSGKTATPTVVRGLSFRVIANGHASVISVARIKQLPTTGEVGGAAAMGEEP